MESTMINLKVLSTAAAMALLLPMLAPSTGSAQGIGSKAEGARGGGGGGGFRAAGGGGGGGGFRATAPSAPSMGGAPAGFRPAPTMGFRPTPGSGGSPVVSGGSQGNYYAGGGGGYRGGGGGYRHHHRGGGFWPGVAVGAGIGIGSTYGYYGSPSYYDDSYGYYDDSAVAAAPPVSDDDAVAYCMQRYRSYDPASGTYLGNDGRRHPCPAQ
jgi:hypothetical protein